MCGSEKVLVFRGTFRSFALQILRGFLFGGGEGVRERTFQKIGKVMTVRGESMDDFESTIMRDTQLPASWYKVGLKVGLNRANSHPHDDTSRNLLY